jgi:hypothetical protein
LFAPEDGAVEVERFDKKYLISCNYGKEITQIRESKTGKEENIGKESCQTRERRKPRKRT